MDDIKLVHLFEIKEDEIMALMNNESVRKQMPLLKEKFSTHECRAFLQAKQELWDKYGYGPWAFRIKGEFAGWGGLQPENGQADFALVLHPKFWGWGRKIFMKVRDWAFKETTIDSITVLFPPSRTNSKAITRLGFVEEGSQIIGGEIFIRYRLAK